MWTEEEQRAELALACCEDELAQERRRNVYYSHLQSQYAQAQTEIRHLRAEQVDLNTRLRRCQEQKLVHYIALLRKCQQFDQLQRGMRERVLSEQARHQEVGFELDEAQARIRELNVRLHDVEYRFDSTRGLLEYAQVSLEASKQQCRLAKLGARRLDNQRTVTINRLVFLILVLHGFSLNLGRRLAPALRSKDTLLARWKVVSDQKVEARRALVRYLRCNADLQQELRQLCARAEDVEKEALKYRALYNDSVKARNIAAKKFKKCYHSATTRYSANTAMFLTGLLALWRMNLILTQRLARAEDTRCYKVDVPPPHRHRLVKFVDAAVQCVPDKPELADAGVQYSPDPAASTAFFDAGVQCTPPSRSSDRISTRNPVQAPAVTVPSTVRDTSTGSGAFMFCVPSESSSLLLSSPASPAEPALRLPAFSADTSADAVSKIQVEEAPIKLPPAELGERVQRLLEKFEALSVMHQSYRNLLLKRSRSTPPKTTETVGDAFQERAPLLFEQRSSRSLAASIHAC